MNHEDCSKNQGQHSCNKADILQTAGDVFCRWGFRKTTMEMIAGAVNKAKSSIYYYFNSKEDIYKNILEKETEEMNRELHRSVEQAEHPFDKLRAYINTRFKELRNLRNFQRAMRDQSLREYTFIQRIAGRQVKWELDTIKRILASGVRAGHLEIKNIETTASTILLSLKGLESSLEGIRERIQDVKSQVDNFIEILLKGLAKNPVPGSA